MKVILRNIVHIITVLLLGLSSMTAVAQGDFILNRFDALEFDGKVQLTCVISSGSTCAGINVYRSNDNIHFQLIGNIAGICGSASAPVTYDYVDEHPIINQVSYYKLELGDVGFTSAISITIRNLNESEIRIQPNPAQSQSTIYFNNATFLTHTLHVISNTGRLVLERTGNDDFFTFDVSELPNGIYPVVITEVNGEYRYFSLLVVQH